jgi:hypothetical protein
MTAVGAKLSFAISYQVEKDERKLSPGNATQRFGRQLIALTINDYKNGAQRKIHD